MPKNIWDQTSTELLDTPKAGDGAIYGQPGETLVVNADRTGLQWAQAGGAGSVGPANTLSIGTVTGGPVAQATITGTAPSQTLNLVLPKGDQGIQGVPGANGADSTVPGPAGPAGPPGPGTTPDEFGNLTEAKISQIQTADVDWIFIVNPESNIAPSGDLRVNKTVPAALNGDMTGHMIRYQASDNSWTDFGRWSGIPGQPGATGPASTVPGPAGAAAQMAIGTVTTLPSGSSATASVTGTAPNFSLNLGLPSGPAGSNGANGATGATGATGPAGPQGPAYIATYEAITNQTIDFGAGEPDMVSRTVTGAASWTFTNNPAAGTVACRFLELTNGGLGTQTWPASVKWENGVVPTLTSAGVDILAFYTRDGGVTHRGVVWAKDSK